MITFNTILKNEGLAPENVKLVRHRDTRFSMAPYQLWLAGDGRMEAYQSYQARAVFNGVSHIASFVATPLNETLFIGMFAINGVRLATNDDVDPLSGDNMDGMNKYDLTQTEDLVDYCGRLIIDWGPGFRSWVQRAGKKDKSIIEISRVVGDPPFPGFLDFQVGLNDLLTVPASWRVALSSVSGVYLLVSPETGKQYVGVAHGQGGFWSRWEEYDRNGHGGNVRMREIPRADYLISILEVAPSSASFDDIIEMEVRWKQKLLTRKFGLNAN